MSPREAALHQVKLADGMSAKRILVVDDDVGVCEALTGILADLGYQVNHATTTEEAVARGDQADLVVCDLVLGHEDGLSLIEQLKVRSPHLKAIVLSGNPSIEALQRSMDLGVACFLTKPTKWSELLHWVAQSFGEEPLRALLFPSRLKEKLGRVAHHLGDVMTADPHDWWLVRTQLRQKAPSCVLVDVSAAETADFFNACQTELGGCCLFLVCREEDFFVARQLVSRFPTARCLSIESSPAEFMRAIRAALEARRETSDRVREAISRDLGRCVYAKPLHTGYYCTVSGPCPFGEEKMFTVAVKGKEYDRCPKRSFPIKDLDRVGVLAWHG
ncbi:MAG: response regulator, partial [Candidatus Rokubacteria bacterium]|nr:response regulator [Candidatus Rokubacteria bacterium]